jgi:hypothetical protein
MIPTYYDLWKYTEMRNRELARDRWEGDRLRASSKRTSEVDRLCEYPVVAGPGGCERVGRICNSVLFL